ncbi:Hypp1905 [Branchiostoma lanceolatum]|uniref:Hypp1905 protein n=1 Tax=Branchiostoma lanceolatum TaxID=7740 RepID=A0A8J9ZP48_BRALA|nr:Hypp1905 [Branchiostoma lanceolatum]
MMIHKPLQQKEFLIQTTPGPLKASTHFQSTKEHMKVPIHMLRDLHSRPCMRKFIRETWPRRKRFKPLLQVVRAICNHMKIQQPLQQKEFLIQTTPGPLKASTHFQSIKEHMKVPIHKYMSYILKVRTNHQQAFFIQTLPFGGISLRQGLQDIGSRPAFVPDIHMTTHMLLVTLTHICRHHHQINGLILTNGWAMVNIPNNTLLKPNLLKRQKNLLCHR